MQRLPDEIAPNDIVQWIQGGWFYVKVQEIVDPVVCCMIGQLPDSPVSPSKKSWKVNTVDGVALTVNDHTMMYTHWPACGAVNLVHTKCAINLERVQKKQWKRTYNSYCLKLTAPGLSAFPGIMSFNSDTREVVRSAFDPVYHTYSTIVNDLFPNQQWKNAAINKDIIISNTRLKKIYVNGSFVGAISRENRLVLSEPSLARRLLPSFDGLVEA